MSEDCRNDCAAPLRFPRRVFNRPGLEHVKYRVGSYADIREFLLRNLDRDPDLQGWTHRGADDPGIALLEGASVLGDILTFYQELYANEAYLRTARWRESIADLTRLIGYRLSPGLGGASEFAFEVKGDRAVTVPAGFPVKAQVEGLEASAEFETTRELTAYPWLGRFRLFRPLAYPPVTPATGEFFILAPDQFAAPVELKEGDRLLVGDALPNGRIANDEIVVVASTRKLHDRTLVRIKGALRRTTTATALVAYKLGRTFRHFGHDGPRKKIIPPAQVEATSTTSGGKTTTTTNVPAPTEQDVDFTRSLTATTAAGVSPDLDRLEFPLDVEVDDLPAGVHVVAQLTADRLISLSPGSGGSIGGGFYAVAVRIPVALTLVRTVRNVRPGALTWGLLDGRASIVTLDQILEDAPPAASTADIRAMRLHETLSPRLTLAAAPREDASPAKGTQLFFFGTQAEADDLKSRRLLIERPDGVTSDAVVTEVAPDFSPTSSARKLLRRVTISEEVILAEFPNEGAAVNVYGNVVTATQGKTERETPLGNGDARQVFQSFKLPKAPLTYLLSVGDTPPEVPELQVWVNDRLWKRVASLFGRGPSEQVYVVREDAAGDSWVQFGDGKTGARLPSGVKNVVARFRTGAGAHGALKPETKVQAGARLDRLDKIQMPGTSAGGSGPEGGDGAREAAPGKIQSLDRLVSIKDFETETLAISGVERAQAAWRIKKNIPAVRVTVLMETGRAAEMEAVRGVLAGFNFCRGPRRFPVVVEEGRLLYVALGVVYGLDPTFREDVVAPKIKAALGVEGAGGDFRRGLFGTLRRRFGEREYATRVEGTVQNVEGVVWAKCTAFVALGEAFDAATGKPIEPSAIPVPAKIPLKAVVACDRLHVLALHARHLTLAAAAEPPKEACR
ncbi:MAG TPA: hypothetical protein VER32_14100 [Pyrinomonadaceae bacterium]|nr:hypothetical protein [Pyrinomonadaceae bacterium]